MSPPEKGEGGKPHSACSPYLSVWSVVVSKRVMLYERGLASSSLTIVQKEIGRVGVIDELIKLNVCSVELVEVNLRHRNFT